MRKWNALVGGLREACDEMGRAWRYTHEPPRLRWLVVAVLVSMPALVVVGVTLGSDLYLGLTVSWWIGALATMLIVYRRSDRWKLDRLPPPPGH